MKYWRSRFLLLPVRNTPLNPSVKEDKRNHQSDQMLKIEGFLRFLENINKIRRVYTSRPLFQTRVWLPYILFTVYCILLIGCRDTLLIKPLSAGFFTVFVPRLLEDRVLHKGAWAHPPCTFISNIFSYFTYFSSVQSYA